MTRSLLRRAALVAALAPAAALAQQNVPVALRPDTRVRLTMVGSDLPMHAPGNGQIVLLAADTASLVVAGLTRGKPDTISYLAFRVIEVLDGRYSRRETVIAGALGGAILGLLMSVSFAQTGDEATGTDPHHRLLAYSMTTGGMGAVLGLALSRERWRAVDPPLRVVADSAAAP